ncbi:MAG: YfiR family protein [Alphaproteobacteria bacterium]|nr:YfiR family protein [Alphaproteobacteria bacterium]
MSRRRQQGRRRAARWICAILPLALVAARAIAQVGAAGEYDVKAAFLYNFARFGEWPAAAFAQPDRFRLCVVGTDPFGPSLGAVMGKPVGARAIEVVRLAAGDDARRCQVAFIGAASASDAIQIARRLDGHPVLTVAEAPRFAQAGGMIELALVDGRVRFLVNPGASQRAGIGLSSQLLKLATIVGDRAP